MYKPKFNFWTVLLFLCTFAAEASAQYSGGSGTPEDPYRIATAEDLITLGANTSDYAAHFILTDDIELSGHTFTTAVIAPDTNNTDVGFQGTLFAGSFDGNNLKITGLTINAGLTGNAYMGLFGRIDAGGQVRNLGLDHVTITNSSYSVNFRTF
jgi:hypothetical protein